MVLETARKTYESISDSGVDEDGWENIQVDKKWEKV